MSTALKELPNFSEMNISQKVVACKSHQKYLKEKINNESFNHLKAEIENQWGLIANQVQKNLDELCGE